jgi:benzylsuccinate CoA-transferase BbsF subunit
VSCAEAIAALLVGSQNIGGAAQDGVFERRMGMGLIAPCTILPCKDGYVWMLAFEPGEWRGLAKAMGDPAWMQQDMFLDMFSRSQMADAIYPLIQQWTMDRTKWEIMDVCQANGNPTTAVFTVAEAAEHPHIRERGYVHEVEHPELGMVRDLGPPFKPPESPSGRARGAPLLGQHNDEVRGALGGGRRPKTRSERPRATGKAFPLEGLRVANFGWVWAGPVAGQTLGFLGAEVYKIESRTRIDFTRKIPPFAEGIADPDRSLQNHAEWGGNGSISLDLTKPEAQELARQLVAKCDVVVESFAPGTMEKFHLSYEELRAVKPDVVMVSMPSTGLYGPLKDISTYGIALTGITGLDSLTGYVGGPPQTFENAYSDPYNGVLGAFAVLVGLQQRERTGKGQHIDYSHQEAMMQMAAPAFMDYFLNGRTAGPIGNRHPLAAAAPHGVFPCKGEDRWVSIAVMTEEEWQGLVKAMGSPAWAQAPGFADAARRTENIEELHERLATWTSGFSDHELAVRLQRCGVAAAPVLNVGDLLQDEHYRARGTFVEVEHPLGFKETIYGPYVKTSHTEVRVRPGPTIGQDNDYVFRELLGLSEERYSELLREQVIY